MKGLYVFVRESVCMKRWIPGPILFLCEILVVTEIYIKLPQPASDSVPCFSRDEFQRDDRCFRRNLKYPFQDHNG